ncbi:MAG TPA: hypothetical protein VE396_15715 [Xanthobacteraceae bacterium]|nr:hypothetical protein [Xanthobacteraceae bacterium]
MFTPPWSNHRLAPDEKYSGSLADMNLLGLQKNGPLSYIINDADITIVIKFSPWIIPWETKSEFRFVTEKQPDGTLRWIPRTLDNR